MDVAGDNSSSDEWCWIGDLPVLPAEPETPGVRRLRVHQRIETHIPARLVRETGSQSTVIADISAFGAGLIGAHRVRINELVGIKLEDGRVIAARVRWQKGVRVGVAFLTPLPDDELRIALPLENPEAAACQSTRQARRSFGKRTEVSYRQTLGSARTLVPRRTGFAWIKSEDAAAYSSALDNDQLGLKPK
jgi:hypothetical protein